MMARGERARFVSIKGLDKAELLAGLYNGARPLGAGFILDSPAPMTAQEASVIISAEGLRFDYLMGRAMKVNLEGDSMPVLSYDGYNGGGAAKRVVDELRAGRGVNSPAIQAQHNIGTMSSTDRLERAFDLPEGWSAERFAKALQSKNLRRRAIGSYGLGEGEIQRLALSEPKAEELAATLERNLYGLLRDAPEVKIEDAEMAGARIGADPGAQIERLAEGNQDARAIASNLRSFWEKIDPDGNSGWTGFFNGFTFEGRLNSADEWYRNREPLRLLQEYGITGEGIVQLYEGYGRDLRVAYLDLVLGRGLERATQEILE